MNQNGNGGNRVKIVNGGLTQMESFLVLVLIVIIKTSGRLKKEEMINHGKICL